MTASKEVRNNKMALLKELLTLWFQERTWRSATYLLLGLPLGIVYFTFVVTATSLSGGMMVTLAGIPLLVGTFIGVRALAKFDAKVSNTIQQTDIVLPPPTWEEGNLRNKIENTLKSRATWKSFAYMVAMLPLGVVNFTAAMAFTALGAMWATFWLWSDWTQIEFTWTVDHVIDFVWHVDVPVDVPWQAEGLVMATGWLMLITAPAILIVMAHTQGRFAQWMLADENIETEQQLPPFGAAA
jgi:hypothetical protein